MWRDFIFDFLLGGLTVAAALLLAALVDPVWGGLLAALPLRLGTTVAFAGLKGDSAFVSQLAYGALLAYVGTGAFIITLYMLLPKTDLTKSFAAAVLACVVVNAIVFRLAGKI